MHIPPHQPLDIVTLVVAIAALLFEPQLAALVGPYTVIVLGAVLGGAWSMSRRPTTTRWSAARYLVMIVTLALLITVPASEMSVAMAARWGYVFESRWIFGPMATVIGGIGLDWPAVLTWAVGIVRSLVERRAQQ